MKAKALRAALQRSAVDVARMAPRVLRERLMCPARTYDNASLDEAARLIIGMQSTAKIPAWSDLPVRSARELFTESGSILSPRSAPLESVRDLALEGPAGPLATRVYRPFGLRGASPALVYFHGGGFVLGSIESHDAVCQTLAAAAGCQVFSVDYRLAPEHAFPAANEDAIAAFRAVVRRADELSVDPDRVAIGGDSAGGYLATQAAITAMRDGDARRPALQLLFYPALDFTMQSASIRGLGEGLFLEERTMRWFLDQFAPAGLDRASPALSPLHNSVESLAGLCAAHIQTAGFDPLRDEAFAYADKLRAAGVSVEHEHYPTLLHGYLNIAGVVDAAVAPYFDAAAALRRAFKAKSAS